ncbi:MAG TPA: hypothetical protein VNQ90_09960 [Chthoniobacteraceae bacterium]|nr:hypothetical protein [Chthoniobacteraceae bacterium]
MKPFFFQLLATAWLLVLPMTGLRAQLSVEVPYHEKAALDLDFTSPAWAGAGRIDGLHKMGSSLSVMGMVANEEAKQASRIYLARDGEALYIGFEYLDGQAEEIAKTSKVDEAHWPKGEVAEIYLDGARAQEGGYYHFAFNAAGSRAESVERSMVPASGWEVVTRIDKDGWRAVARIPYAKLGMTADAPGLRGLFYRDYHSHAREEGKNERSTWGGGALHSPDAFGELIFTGGKGS